MTRRTTVGPSAHEVPSLKGTTEEDDIQRHVSCLTSGALLSNFNLLPQSHPPSAWTDRKIFGGRPPVGQTVHNVSQNQTIWPFTAQCNDRGLAGAHCWRGVDDSRTLTDPVGGGHGQAASNIRWWGSGGCSRLSTRPAPGVGAMTVDAVAALIQRRAAAPATPPPR